MPRKKGCHHNWDKRKYNYLPAEEGRERLEYEATCSKCFEERYHYWVQFEKREGLQPLARKFQTEPKGWKKATTIYDEPSL